MTTEEIPGDDVPEIGDDLADREEYLNGVVEEAIPEIDEEIPDVGDDLLDREVWLNDPDHVDHEVMFPDVEPS